MSICFFFLSITLLCLLIGFPLPTSRFPIIKMGGNPLSRYSSPRTPTSKKWHSGQSTELEQMCSWFPGITYASDSQIVCVLCVCVSHTHLSHPLPPWTRVLGAGERGEDNGYAKKTFISEVLRYETTVGQNWAVLWCLTLLPTLQLYFSLQCI